MNDCLFLPFACILHFHFANCALQPMRATDNPHGHRAERLNPNI